MLAEAGDTEEDHTGGGYTELLAKGGEESGWSLDDRGWKNPTTGMLRSIRWAVIDHRSDP